MGKKNAADYSQRHFNINMYYYFFSGSAAFLSQQEDFPLQLLLQSPLFVVSFFFVSAVLVSVLAALASLSSTMDGTGLFEIAAKEGATDTPRKATNATSATIFFIIFSFN
jgi:hypothetical protein